MLKARKIAKGILILLLVLYFLEAIVVGAAIGSMARKLSNNCDLSGAVMAGNYLRSPVLVFHWGSGGRAIFWYSQNVKDELGNVVSGSRAIPVIVDFVIRDGNLKILNVYEAP